VTLELAEQLRLERCHLSLGSGDHDKVVDVRKDNTAGGVDTHIRVSFDWVIAYSGMVAGKLLVLYSR
jgi:hypothetical protein